MDTGVTPPLQRNKENLRFCHSLRDPELKPVVMLEEEELSLWLFICFCLGESALGCWSLEGAGRGSSKILAPFLLNRNTRHASLSVVIAAYRGKCFIGMLSSANNRKTDVSMEFINSWC